MKRVTFVPQHVAERINQSSWFEDGVIAGNTIGISCRHPEDGPLFCLDEGWFTHLFDDVETPVPGAAMFDMVMAGDIIRAVDSLGSKNVVVHCSAGMSRSAAVAKWLSDNHGYELWIHPDGVGTVKHYNRHVYRTFDAVMGKDLATYYAELEAMTRAMS